MSTRSVIGFYSGRKLRTEYQHSDSYPTWTGREMARQVEKIVARGVDNVKLMVDSIRMVKQNDVPSNGDIKRLARFLNLDVSSQSAKDWYCLLRDRQGDLVEAFECGVMIDCNGFYSDSLFCEWGYIINLDAKVLEVYKGFQKEKHNKGRFAKPKASEEGYYPIKEIARIPFDKIDTSDEFWSEFEKEFDPPE